MKPIRAVGLFLPVTVTSLLMASTEQALAFASPCPSYEQGWAPDSFLDRPQANFKDFLKTLRSPGVATSSLKGDFEKLPAAGRKCATVMACFRDNKFSLEKLGHTYGDAGGTGLVPSTGEARELIAKLERDKGRYKNCEALHGAAEEEVKGVQTWQSVLSGFRVRH